MLVGKGRVIGFQPMCVSCVSRDKDWLANRRPIDYFKDVEAFGLQAECRDGDDTPLTYAGGMPTSLTQSALACRLVPILLCRL